MKKFYLLLIVGFLSYNSSFAQEIKNLKVQIITENLINITYDLVSNVDGELYDVFIYSSYDNFTKPLTYVTGDVGTDIKTGTSKKISWKAQAELIEFDGKITVEIRAKLSFAPIAIQKEIPNTKKGKSIQIEWNGSRPADQLLIELYKDTTKIRSISTVNNTGFYNWQVPDDFKTGKNYKFKISSINTPSNHVNTNYFAIKPKIPLGLKILPIAVIGGVAAAVLGGSKGSSGDPDLPGPTSPK